MITSTIIFDHRNRTEPGKEGPLEIRVRLNRKTYYISTGIKVRKCEWKQGVIVDRVNAPELNKRLGVIYRRVEEEVNQALENGSPINIQHIKRQAWMVQIDNTSTSLLDWMREQIEIMPLDDGTIKRYHTFMNRLEQYGEIKRWSDISAEQIVRWDAWLHQLTKRQTEADRLTGLKPELISDAAIYNYHKCMKALLNRAMLFDRLEYNPYQRLRGMFKRGERERIDYLTEKEMKAFENLKPLPGSAMAMARDMFVIQMYTGLSYSDMQRFDISKYKMVDGVWRNVGERIKTGVAYVSQLLPPVLEILERYNYQVPKLDNSDYNKCLKALGAVAGIERPLHSHMARHTFATWALRNGVPIEHVSRMLGHTNITQTQRYAKIVADDIHHDFDMLANKIEKS